MVKLADFGNAFFRYVLVKLSLHYKNSKNLHETPSNEWNNYTNNGDPLYLTLRQQQYAFSLKESQ
jgi:hypothetical protein